MNAPVITYWPSLTDPQGSEWAAPDWETILTRLSLRRDFQGDKEHPGWSPARFDPCQRAAENVRDLCGLCLDFDGGVSIDWALDKFAQFYGLLQTTRKHAPDVHRFRIVLPLSRRISPFEHGELWKRVAHWCGHLDPSCKDPGRFWFLPGVKEGGEFRAERLAGKDALDVDFWLSVPLPAPAPVRVERSVDASQAEQRASRYIARMPEALAGSHGHDATWQVACALACGFDLGEETTFQLLWTEYNPRCQPAWSEKELRHKAKHARQNTRLERGYLLRETRDWSPAQRVTQPAPVAPDLEPESEPESGAHEAGPQPMREPGDDSDELNAAGARPAFEVTGTELPKKKPINERFGLFTERELIRQVFDHVNSDKPKKGFTIGVPEIDTMLGGLRLGMITCVGGQTSFGKSTLATMILEENLKVGVKVLVISNEDQPLMYGRRIVCRRGNFNALCVRDGELVLDEINRIWAMQRAASDGYVLMNAMGVPAEGIAEAILACREELGTQLVLIDYLQRVRLKSSSQDRRNEVSRVAELLGDAIKRSSPTAALTSPASGVVFSQLKRLQDKPPTLEDMKESGDVENMAEHIILGWRRVRESVDGEENVSRLYNIPKNKDGPVSLDWNELEFDPATASFTGRLGGFRRSAARGQFDGFGTDARYP